MTTPDKVGETKHRASPPVQKVGTTCPCPPTDLRPSQKLSSRLPL